MATSLFFVVLSLELVSVVTFFPLSLWYSLCFYQLAAYLAEYNACILFPFELPSLTLFSHFFIAKGTWKAHINDVKKRVNFISTESGYTWEAHIKYSSSVRVWSKCIHAYGKQRIQWPTLGIILRIVYCDYHTDLLDAIDGIPEYVVISSW